MDGRSMAGGTEATDKALTEGEMLPEVKLLTISQAQRPAVSTWARSFQREDARVVVRRR